MRVILDDGLYEISDAKSGKWWTLSEAKDLLLTGGQMKPVNLDGALGKKILRAVREFDSAY